MYFDYDLKKILNIHKVWKLNRFPLVYSIPKSEVNVKISQIYIL